MGEIKRGDIYYADLYPVVGSEQGGIRPVLIIQNDTGNHYSPTVIAAAITGRKKKPMPTHVQVCTKGLNGPIHRPAGTDPDDRPAEAFALCEPPGRECHADG